MDGPGTAEGGRSPARTGSPRARGRTALACAASLAVTVVTVGAGPASADTTALVDETFTGSSVVGDWVKPLATNGTNEACLTASADTSNADLPGCSPGPDDPSGSGALRLTSFGQGAIGSLFHGSSVPTAQGLYATFDTYQHAGSGADGLSFALAAADPAAPGAPAQTGMGGGALGYSSAGGGTGLPNGYLGFGLDVYGAFSSPTLQHDVCALPSGMTNTGHPQQGTVRGPGDGLGGYCILASSAQDGGLDGLLDNRLSWERTGTRVPVEVAINPTGAVVATSSGLAVPAGSWLFSFTPIGGTQKTMTGLLPTVSNNAELAASVPSSWINPATGLPYRLTFGWTAATGSLTEMHEVANFSASTLAGKLPAFTLATSDDGDGDLPEGGTATFAVVGGLEADGGDEAETVTMTHQFDVGLAPGDAAGPGWACSTTVRTVRCSRTPTGPAAAGSSFPTILVPVHVEAGASGTLGFSVQMSSSDANAATATHSGTVVHRPGVARNVAATGGKRSIVVSWDPPTSDGGSPVTGYTVAATPVTGTATTVIAAASSSAATISGLQPATLYDLSVTTHNVVGDGPVTAFAQNPVATIVLPPGPPTAVTAVAGNRSIDVSWAPPGEDGGAPLTGYVVTATSSRDGRSATSSLAAGSRSVTLTGLENTTSYEVTVAAANGAGPGARSAVVRVTPSRLGSWLVAADGGVFALGDAAFLGSTGALVLNSPMVGMASTPSGNGYWLVAADGGVFAFGDARFLGSTAAMTLNQPMVGIASTPTGGGYWLIAADGGIFAFGDARFLGSTGATTLSKPIVGVASTPTGRGYRLVAADGGVFAFGDAAFLGSTGATTSGKPIVGIASTPTGRGYWLAAADGAMVPFGDARVFATAGAPLLRRPIVGAGTAL